MSKNLNYNLTFAPNSNISNMGNIFTTGGNVGIGTSAPAFTVDISGTLETTNANGVFLFASNGNVGIGTTVPNARLRVNGQIVVPLGNGISLNGNSAADNTAYALHSATSGTYGIRLSGADDPALNRPFEVGYYTTGTSTWNTRFSVNSYNGNVGINTTSAPVSTLDVINSSTGQFPVISRFLAPNTTGGSSQSPRIVVGIDATDSISMSYYKAGTTSANNYIGWGHNNVADGQMVLTRAGNVGINTGNPLARLDISGGGDNNGAGGESMLSLQYRNSGFRHFIVSRHNSIASANTGNAIDFYLNSTNTASGSSVAGTGNVLGMTIAANGTGIKTTSTTSALTVNNIVFDRNVFDHSVSPLTVTQNASSGTSVLNDQIPVIHLCRQGLSGQTYGQRATFALSRYENSSTNSRTRLDIQLAQNFYDTQTVMSIRGDGNVGIGTTTPGTSLHVYNPTNPYTMYLEGSSSSGGMRISSSTNYLEFGIAVASGSWSTNAATGDGVIRTNKNLILQASYTGGSHIFIQTSGNVGIGMASPTYTLDVNGTFEASNANGVMMLNAGGNVGIGTTSPANRLHAHVAAASQDVRLILSDATTTVASNRGLHLIKNGTQHAYLWNYENGFFQLGTNNTRVITMTGGNVGIGTDTPNSKLSITPSSTEAKITLWDGGGTTNHYGFGVSAGQMNYHVETTGADHVFYAGGKNGNGTELARIKGTGVLSVSGVVKSSIPSWMLYATGSNGGVTGIVTYNNTGATAINCTVNAGAGRVTCTVAGRYFIFFSGFAHMDGNTTTEIWLRKNGTNTAYRVYNGSKLANAYGPSMTLNVIMDLGVNDYIEIFVNIGNLHGNQDCYFGGYMIG